MAADSAALRTRRARRHKRGEHDLCRESAPCRQRLRVAGPDDAPDGLVDAIRCELAGADPVVLAMGLRLAEVASRGNSVAQVSATRALAELVAAQREAGL